MLITPILHTVALMQISKTIPAYLSFLSFYPLFLAFGLLAAFASFPRANGWPIFILLIVGIFTGFLSSFINGNFSLEVVPKFFSMLTMLLLFYWAANTRIEVKKVEEVTLKFAQFAFFGVFFALIVLYVGNFVFHFPVYLGLSTEYLIISLVYVLWFKPKFSIPLIIIILLMFFLAGKRGQLLVAAMMLFAVLYVFYPSYKNYFILILLMLIASVVMPWEVIWNYVEENFSRFDLSKVQSFDDLNQFTSGRLDELLVVYQDIVANIYSLLLGNGFGATFELYGYQKSTVHVSPIGVAWIYGVPFSVVLYLALIWVCLRIIVKYKKKMQSFWALVTLSQLLTTMSVFTIFLNPVLWVSLGLALRRKYQ